MTGIFSPGKIKTLAVVYCSLNIDNQGSYSFELINFHAATFKSFRNFRCFTMYIFFDLIQCNRHKLWCPPKCCCAVQLLVSIFVLALTTAVNSIPNINLFFQDFPGMERILMPIQTLHNKYTSMGMSLLFICLECLCCMLLIKMKFRSNLPSFTN